jgi:hypothetical protein
MISIKSCNPFSRSECLAITEESCSFDSNIVFEFYCLLWLFAKLIKFLDYVLFLQVQTHFLEQYHLTITLLLTNFSNSRIGTSTYQITRFILSFLMIHINHIK